MSRGILRFIVAATAALMVSGPAPAQESAKAPVPRNPVGVDFDGVAPGGLPAVWRVDATNHRGTLAVWKVTKDPTAPSAPNVLEAIPRPDNFGGTSNLFWTPSIPFQDGEIEVRLRADTGHEDQGGGHVWRVQDGDNYDVARYNPLEHNFRVYTVRHGARKMMDSASRIKVPRGQWFTIRIVQHGEHIQCFLDGQKLLDVHDATFTRPGGVGLWTESDPASSFDDLVVRRAAE